MRKTRKEKGITLVALIITIIVMMILVAVSVAVIIRSDLLGTAKNAGIKYRDNMNYEENLGTGDIKIGDKTWDEFMQSICNHEFGEWEIDKQPTAYEAGQRHRECGKCGIEQRETMPTNECEEDAHTYGEYEIIAESTCIAQGKKQKTCSTCGKEVEEDIAVDNVNGHNYTEATCTEKATCTLCGAETGELAAHQYENGECEVCGAEKPVPYTASEIAVMSRTVKRDEYYGKTVDYGVDYGDKTVDGYGTSKNAWEIFYIGPSPTNKNVNNIYLIARGYLPFDMVSFSGRKGTIEFVDVEGNVVLDESKYPAVAAGWLNKTYDPFAETKLLYSSSYTNMKATQYLLDSTNIKWSGFKNTKADWVIGAPTYEMLIASYNDYYDTDIELTGPVEGAPGYPMADLSGTGSLRKGFYLNHRTQLLACFPRRRLFRRIEHLVPLRRPVFRSGWSFVL